MIVPYASPIPRELLNPGVSQPIRIERREGAWVGEGIWQDDASVAFVTGRGFIYPSTTDDLLALPEGERITKSLTLFWPKQFQMNDRVEYEGEEYRVVHIAPWQKYGFQMAIAQVNQIEPSVERASGWSALHE
jgi:hypothetical protein